MDMVFVRIFFPQFGRFLLWLWTADTIVSRALKKRSVGANGKGRSGCRCQPRKHA